MMKLVLSLTLILALSNTAGALQCQICSDYKCTSTVPFTCSSDWMCITTVIQATNSSGTTTQQIVKSCGPPSICPATGSQTMSINFGMLNANSSTKCCNTDNCNSETLPFPAAQPDNNLQCFTCNSNSSQCTSKLRCKGVQDRCYKAILTAQNSTIPLFGCVSANQCRADAATLDSLPYLHSFANYTSGPSCCETNLCNTVKTTTTSEACCIRLGMVHLLLGLLIFILC